MVNYQNGKVYKIVCNTTGLQYFGSTCEPLLSRRLHQHKNALHAESAKRKSKSHLVLENDNYEIILVEYYPCSSKDELHARERFYIENYECVNKAIPIRYEGERSVLYKKYYEDNKECLLNKMKLYAESHKDAIAMYRKQYREEHSDELKESGKKNKRKYREEHLVKLRESEKKNSKKYREKKNTEKYFLQFLNSFNV